MTEATVWWVLAGAVVGVELLTGTFYLLMMSLGLAAGAVAAHLGLPLAGQLTTAAVVGGGAVAAWHQWQARHPKGPTATKNANVNMDVGATVFVADWPADGTAAVQYRGSQWRVAMASNHAHSGGGNYRVVEVVGSCLMLVRA